MTRQVSLSARYASLWFRFEMLSTLHGIREGRAKSSAPFTLRWSSAGLPAAENGILK